MKRTGRCGFLDNGNGPRHGSAAKLGETMAKRRLEKGIAIVTGASSGIGRELAIGLAAAEVSVIVTARREDRLCELVSRIEQDGGQAIAVVGDITSPEMREQLVQLCRDRFGSLDFLINNAGISAMGPFADATPERLRRIMEVNFFAPAEMIRLALPLMRQSQRAMIVNLGSVLGHRAVALKSEYCASKFALHGLSDALRAELASAGIDVLLVSPSTTDSELFDSAIEDVTGVEWKRRGATRAHVVAQKTMAAMRRGSHEIILTPGGKILVWLDRLAPTLANRMIQRAIPRRKPNA
jgi:short-subunit dehydrogenase